MKTNTTEHLKIPSKDNKTSPSPKLSPPLQERHNRIKEISERYETEKEDGKI
jgi:hypothetical protein